MFYSVYNEIPQTYVSVAKIYINYILDVYFAYENNAKSLSLQKSHPTF